MPAVRLSRRRKSSHALFTPAKPGIYGIPQRPVTFAPNVTPITFVDSDDPADNAADGNSASSSPTATLFPPSETPAAPPARKRCPPGKRRSQGYIPRPPNAFMLFRADFVRQKHVPGSIETNHGSLSKIIGTCWRQLPLEEKRVWEVRAKQEKANHKAQFPDYRFRPVHNKNKGGVGLNGTGGATEKREKHPTTFEDERRCEEVAQLLLEGKKGDELARAVRTLDMERERELSQLEMMGMGSSSRRDSYGGGNPPSSGSSASPASALHMHIPLPLNIASSSMLNHNHQIQSQHMYMRRPSSVPLPNEYFATYGGGAGIAMPALPFLQSLSRSASPVASIARHQQFPVFRNQSFSAYFQPTTSTSTHPTSTDDFAYSQTQTHTQNQAQDDFASFAFSNPFAPNATLAAPPSAAGTLFTPSFSPGFSPGFGSGFGHPTLAQRNSLGGLGRRASSAQPMGGMRSWGDLNFGDTQMNHQQYLHTQQLMLDQMRNDHQMIMMPERDHSPLPDVEPELFAPDFSFGASTSSSTTATNVLSSSSSSTFASTSPSSSADHASLSVSPVQRPSPLNPVAPVPVQSAYAPHHGHSRSLDGMYAPDQYVPVEEQTAYASDRGYAVEDVYVHQEEAYSHEVVGVNGGMWHGEEMMGKSEMGMGMGVHAHEAMGMEYYESAY